MGVLDNKSVKKVRKALLEAGLGDNVIELKKTAKTAEDAAKAVGTELGSIVKSLVFMIGDQPVMALVAGDHMCKTDALPRALALDEAYEQAGGKVKRANANQVRAATGFIIGGVSPVGRKSELPTVIDVSLKRFETVYAAAGHSHCIFPTTVANLKRLTDGIVSYAIAEPVE
ncbi:MAG: YbaK/EbsC family protein [Rhodospirillales bacterium]|jgi:prolyl-tRNA editing enzyme YbaK/EbsC (Cys-tRNA(Pro) deacylase)|nr:YbaK/EbsC family protein [Rhodospirillales bacterium]HJO72036.1 YbaK/EbsC family protein [Rhodospirillales bacterium]